MRKTNFPRAPRVLSPDAPRSRHNGPSASDMQCRPEKPRPQPPQPFPFWSLPQTTHLPRTFGMLPFSQDFSDASFFVALLFSSRAPRVLSPGAPRSRHNGPSASDTQSRPGKPRPQPPQPFRLWSLPQTTHPPRTFGMLPFFRKNEAPTAPTFPALVYPANHPSAQDFWDASFFSLPFFPPFFPSFFPRTLE